MSYALKLLREKLIWLLMRILDFDLIVTNKTRPEVSKLTPENKRSSQVTKLSPAESILKHTNRHTEIMNSFGISLQTSQEYLPKV